MASDNLALKLTRPDFDVNTFVSYLSSSGREDELLDMKQKIQILSEETAQSLKKNVYKNYSQFIETAKEISILEGEMYQLSHMLTEQKTILMSMMKLSLVSDKAIVEGLREAEPDTSEEDTRRNLAFLLEKVEGCSSVTEVPGRLLIHNGDLIELDSETFAVIQRVHAFLLNDSIMIASWLPNRRGPLRYRFQGLYELDGLAVVNVRDVGPVKCAFKILMFPDTRMYQADSTKAKRQWLDIIEDTKKKKAAHDKQKKEAAVRQLEAAAAVPNTPTSPADTSSPFSDAEESDFLDDLSFDWVQEMPEDLDMCIAQRDFEGAVDLVEKVTNHLKDCDKTPAIKEFRARIDHRVKQLTEGLMGELQVSPERSLRGGPRAARRAVTQLIRLGKSTQACDLFLKNRSSMIKYNIRQLKFEGATSLYVKQLCSVFFSNLSDTGREFLKAFPEHYGCYSAFVVWTKQELRDFVGTFGRQVFGGKSTLSTNAECVHLARKHCNELSFIGLDLTFCLDSLIGVEVQRLILESRDRLVEAVQYRASEDKWRPMNHLTKITCNKFLEEMAAAGIDIIQEHVYDECFISLTMNTALFAKLALSFADDILKLHTPDLNNLVEQSITDVFKAQVSHIEDSLTKKTSSSDHKFILKNAQFILESLLSKVEALYQQNDLPFPQVLVKTNSDYRRLKTVSLKSLR